MELTIAVTILILTIFLFISGKIRADFVALLSLLALAITGILTPEEALSGFSNSTVIMLAGLFVVGGGIVRTGLARKVSLVILYYTKNNEKALFVLILSVVAIVGAFISNTGTVAIMLPVVIGIAMKMEVSSGKYLIPLAFAANLSGFMTLISTPTNLIISQMLTDNGFEGLSFFSITPIGIIAFIVGVIYLLLVRGKLLPKTDQSQVVNEVADTPNTLIKQYDLKKHIQRVFVPKNASIVDKKLEDIKLSTNYHSIVLKIERTANDGFSLLPHPHVQEMAGPNSIIQANDILYIQGTNEQIQRFAEDHGLTIKNGKKEEFISSEIGVAEVLLTPDSRLINKTVAESGFRKKYHLNIIGVNRKGTFISENLSAVRLRFGDALLVQGKWEDIEFLSNDTRDVVVIGQPSEYASMAAASGKEAIAAGILLLMIGLMIFNVFPTVVSVLLAAVLMILTGCLRNMDDAYSQINWHTIILIGAMLPWSIALEKTGGLTIISNAIIDLLGGFGPVGMMAGIYLVTTIFGQLMSNTATTVLFAPIAMKAALEIGINPYPFMIAVGTAACMSFSTPFSSPTNALVMTAGNYKFMDFFKVGAPLTFIMFIVMMLIIPILFPF